MGTLRAGHDDAPSGPNAPQFEEPRVAAGAAMAATAELTGSGRASDGSRPYDPPPRGNPPIEQVDLDRGREKLERVLGW
jgi:hypothetical protein